MFPSLLLGIDEYDNFCLISIMAQANARDRLRRLELLAVQFKQDTLWTVKGLAFMPSDHNDIATLATSFDVAVRFHQISKRVGTVHDR